MCDAGLDELLALVDEAELAVERRRMALGVECDRVHTLVLQIPDHAPHQPAAMASAAIRFEGHFKMRSGAR